MPPKKLERKEISPPALGAVMWTIDQTALAMTCSRPTVYQRIREGSIAAYKVGEVIRIDPESVRAFLFARPLRPETPLRSRKGARARERTAAA